jgi:hypothetical protein
MRIRATCNECGRDFLFSQLYRADALDDGSCPHCDRPLGMTRARHLALAADRAGVALVHALRGIADRAPAFTIQPDSVLARVEEVVADLAAQPSARGEARLKGFLRRAA